MLKITSDFLKKIRRIEITTTRMATDVFAGQYRSVFKGRGIEFEEVREYTPGDDVRSIDWNVTARMGRPFIKKFIEERELTVMFLLDISSSCFFATVNQLKNQLAAEICSVLAFSAIKNNDKVGLMAFGRNVEHFLPARKGPRHVLRVIRDALYYSSDYSKNPSKKGTDVNAALEYFNKLTYRNAIVFIISDFYSFRPDNSGEYYFDFKKQLSATNKRHDVIAVTITDPSELYLNAGGILSLVDAETGMRSWVDSSNEAVRKAFREDAHKIYMQRQALFRSIKVDNIDIRTDAAYLDALIKFFKARERRLH